MSKYNALWEYIKETNKPELKLTYEENAQIAGVEIDHSFLTYKKELLLFGYQVGKISMKENTVMFLKMVGE